MIDMAMAAFKAFHSEEEAAAAAATAYNNVSEEKNASKYAYAFRAKSTRGRRQRRCQKTVKLSFAV